MRKLLLLVIVLIACSCGSKNERNVDKFYYDIDLKIILINSESILTEDKYHTPQLCNLVLFETLTEPKLYMELNTYNLSHHIKMDTKWFYNHKPGDVVHFDHLLKNRFFEIDKDHRPYTKNPLN